MTVCVAVKVHDCIVFAADSASTLSLTSQNGVTQVLNVYNNADKVFNLQRNLPIVAMTCGMGHIGGRSISHLAKELRHQLSAGSHPINALDYTIEEVVSRAHEFIATCYSAAHPQPRDGDYLEFWVGGYGSTNTHGEIWKIVVENGVPLAPQRLNAEADGQGVFWGGQGQAIMRLLLGIDPAFVGALEAAGVQRSVAETLFGEARTRMETPVLHATMPTIDAIRLAEFLVDVTKGYFSFAFGSDIVGGPTDVATVTKWEGFKWIKRKHYYPPDLNRKDHDHVR